MSISENWVALQSTWEAARQATKDTEMRAKIIGVASQMERFDYFFGIELGQKYLNMVDNLSRSLQRATISACEGQEIVKKTVQSLQSIQSSDHFDLFWKYLEHRCSEFNISPPQLPRRKRPPRTLDIGGTVLENPSMVQDHF